EHPAVGLGAAGRARDPVHGRVRRRALQPLRLDRGRVGDDRHAGRPQAVAGHGRRATARHDPPDLRRERQGAAAGRDRTHLRGQRDAVRGLHRRRQQGRDRRPDVDRRRRVPRRRGPPARLGPRRRHDRVGRRERVPAGGRGRRRQRLGVEAPRQAKEGRRQVMNLASVLTESAGRNGDAVAIKLDDAELSYKQLDGGSAHVAGLLKSKGVEPGDRVGIMLPNVPYFPVVYYGVLRLGAVVVPMNVLLKGREVTFYLKDPEAKVLFAWHEFAEAAEQGAAETDAEVVLVKPGEVEDLVGSADAVTEAGDCGGDDTAVILYTSGTTGTPKGAELTHDNLTSNVSTILETLIQIEEDDVVLGALPLFHSFGQTCGLNSCIAAGGTLSLIPRFDPDKALEIIARDRVTIFEGVPTMYVAMLHSDKADSADTSTLRLCVSGGSAMPGEVLRAFEDKFGCKILEGYGLSE